MSLGFLWSEGWQLDGEWGWFALAEYNILCKINLETKKICFVSRIPASNYSDRAFTYILKKESKIILLPDREKRLFIFDCVDGSWNSIPFVDHERAERIRCTYAFWENDLLVVYAAFLKMIVYVDINRCKIVKMYSIPDSGNIEALWDQDIVVYEDYLYIPSRAETKIYRFNRNNHIFSTYSYDVNCEFRTITKCNDELWLTGTDSKIHVIDLESLAYKESIIINDRCNSHTEYPYIYAFYNDGYIWLIPYDNYQFVCIDVREKKLSYYDGWTEKNTVGEEVGKMLDLHYVRNETVLGVSSPTGALWELNTKSKSFHMYKYDFYNEQELYTELLASLPKPFLKEKTNLGLLEYLKYMV